MISQVCSTPIAAFLNAGVSEVLDYEAHEATESLPSPEFTEILSDGYDFINSFSSEEQTRNRGEFRSHGRPFSIDHGEYDRGLTGNSELFIPESAFLQALKKSWFRKQLILRVEISTRCFSENGNLRP